MTLADFAGVLHVYDAKFYLGDVRALDSTAGGDQVPSTGRARLWRGSFSLVAAYHADAQEIDAALDLLTQPGASFLVAPTERDGPSSDPDGAILSASVPTISAISSDNREIALSGLPSGYQLRRGDMLSFQYGANPVRYAFHRVWSPRVASGAGAMSNIELTSPVRAGAASGVAVKLVRPELKAVITQGGAERGTIGNLIRTGVSLSWEQTLR
ncbi:hypothetical protein V8J84_03905 [Yoonia sp. 208BN28-4]